MKTSRSILTVAAGLLLAASPRLGIAEEPAAQVRVARPQSRELLTPFGEYFLVGGGVTNYLDDTVKSNVDTGGTWDLRLGFGTRFYAGVEAAYVGSARNSASYGSTLLANGAEGVVRLQYPYVAGDWLIEPFGFGGAGWTHLRVNNPVRTAGVQDSDDIFVMPVGAGILLAYDHFLFDGRFTYRQSFNESLIRNADGTAASLKSWAVTASVGYEF